MKLFRSFQFPCVPPYPVLDKPALAGECQSWFPEARGSTAGWAICFLQWSKFLLFPFQTAERQITLKVAVKNYRGYGSTLVSGSADETAQQGPFAS